MSLHPMCCCGPAFRERHRCRAMEAVESLDHRAEAARLQEHTRQLKADLRRRAEACIVF